MSTGQRKKSESLTGIIGQNSCRRTFLKQCWTCTYIYWFWLFTETKTCLRRWSMWSFRLSFSCSWGSFLFWIFFFAEVTMFNRLGKTCVFFSRIFYGAPLPDWDEGFRGLLVEVVTVTLEVDSWLFCRFPFFFYFQFNRQSRNKIMSMYTDSMSAQIGITTMFAILVAADLVGNTIVCLIIIVFHDMR